MVAPEGWMRRMRARDPPGRGSLVLQESEQTGAKGYRPRPCASATSTSPGSALSHPPVAHSRRRFDVLLGYHGIVDDCVGRDQNPFISTLDVVYCIFARIGRAGRRRCSNTADGPNHNEKGPLVMADRKLTLPMLARNARAPSFERRGGSLRNQTLCGHRWVTRESAFYSVISSVLAEREG